MVFSLLVLFTLLVKIASAVPLARSNEATFVNLRIEGATRTIFEGPIITRGHNVTTASGGEHHCDGTNHQENPSPGPTCTSALDDASHLAHFTWDGPYDPPTFNFDDFFITRIADSEQTSTQFWGILLNFQFTPVGGCQQRVAHDDHVLWAFDAFSKSHFLKLAGPTLARKGHPVTVTVTDGSTGQPIYGAQVGGATTGADGKAILTFHTLGVKSLKAEEAQSIRSNAIKIVVVP